MSTYDFEPNPEDYGPEPAHIANGTHKKTLLVASPKREWVGLTDWQIAKVLQQCQDEQTRPPSEDFAFKFARAIEAKLKEKNA